MSIAVVLCNPKTPYNVGSAIRACSIYGVPTLALDRHEDLDR